jgi:DNA-binding GntR family transcriptional regulator
LKVKDRFQTAHDEHVAIVSAIAARDVEKAEQMAMAHIRNAQRARLKLMRASLVAGGDGN